MVGLDVPDRRQDRPRHTVLLAGADVELEVLGGDGVLGGLAGAGAGAAPADASAERRDDRDAEHHHEQAGEQPELDLALGGLEGLRPRGAGGAATATRGDQPPTLTATQRPSRRASVANSG